MRNRQAQQPAQSFLTGEIFARSESVRITSRQQFFFTSLVRLHRAIPFTPGRRSSAIAIAARVANLATKKVGQKIFRFRSVPKRERKERVLPAKKETGRSPEHTRGKGRVATHTLLSSALKVRTPADQYTRRAQPNRRVVARRLLAPD